MLSQYDRDQGDDCRSKGSQQHNICFANPSSIIKDLSNFGANQGSQPFLTGNFSASTPMIGAVKLELPSLQYPDTTLDEWFPNPSLPQLESVDSLIQSTPGTTQSDCPSPRSSGLLEALVYEGKALTITKDPSSERSSNSSVVTPKDLTNCSPFKTSSTEYEVYNKSNLPFGNSPAYTFSNCTPIRVNLKSEPMSYSWDFDEGEKESSTELNYLRPDAILGSCWLGESTSCRKGQGTMTDVIATLLGDNKSTDFRNTASGTSTPVNSFGFGSCPCNISSLSHF
ncbi:hypothetical protein Leryth_018808 [Lithospermum erythrorhizon]|nr:hypothetical protein Leryth_018808 [Lithospermum erythrorhizon]